MKDALRKLIVREGRKVLDKIESGTCEMSEDEAIDFLDTITHIAISKEQAQEQMNLQRSRFDDLVREGTIPKGRKRKGFKELVWFKDELNKLVRRF